MEPYSKAYTSISKAKKYIEERVSLRGLVVIETEVKAVSQLMEKVNSKEVVVELGIGSGAFGFNLMNNKSVNNYIGLDSSLAMLSMAKKNLNMVFRSLKPNVDLVLGDARYLPFKQASFNGVISIRLISHLSNKYVVFKEVSRVLNSRGFMVFDYYDSESLLALIGAQKEKRGDFTNLKELQGCINDAELSIRGSASAFLLGLTLYDKIPEILLKPLKLFDSLFSQLPFLRRYATRKFVLITKNIDVPAPQTLKTS
ncbi:class I SAM-dependent methyltransferase [Candidatus Hecatella orcuttiae]|jgi:SAM-dependent methyltransferase|uniref:class I SAM-dependent methyltransferase n=1 Tax=Candidatus Hecatella orcuttiae TaxID=1935119 RepID=UPI002867FB8C|nr:class I SAM-dependent methyltransferase [Candidatus Hecatella orcuttiae]